MTADQPSPVAVPVSGGTGVVGVNYGQVFNNFHAAPERPVALTSLVRSRQFAALVEDRASRFVGREFVFAEVDRVLAGDEFGSGYVVITGEPGIGKTSIAAEYVVRRQCVHHFNVVAENIRTPGQFLENTCAQVILKYGLPYDSLPVQATEDSGFLGQVLAEASAVAKARGEGPVLVVVDALDEADRTTAFAEANRLFLPRVLPDGVFVLLTAREESDFRLDVDARHDIWIRDDDPANLADVETYVLGYIGAHPIEFDAWFVASGRTAADLVQELVLRSEGNFMYLFHVLPDLTRGRWTADGERGSADLPNGLRGYYQRHWRAMKDADEARFTTRQRPVLCFLAVSREPQTVATLVEWTGIGPGEVKPILDEWREFLNETSGPPARFRLYHRSFADFLDAEENLRWYHAQIADAALAKIPGFLNAG